MTKMAPRMIVEMMPKSKIDRALGESGSSTRKTDPWARKSGVLVVIRDVTAIDVRKSRVVEATKYSEQRTVLSFTSGFNLVIVFWPGENPDR